MKISISAATPAASAGADSEVALNSHEQVADDDAPRGLPENALVFERLEVERVPDRIERGSGFILSSLSPGITLIHGPNGSGKSTTLRLLQQFLWPGEADLGRVTATGAFRCRGRRWQVDLDAGHPRHRCDGQPHSGPEVGESSHRHRYRLALDELLQATDGDFASNIHRESLGGYDLDHASRRLSFNARPAQPVKKRDALEAAKKARVDAERRQQATADDATRLDALRRERDEARTAAAEHSLFEKVRDLRASERLLSEVEAKIAAWPPTMSRLRGDELERLEVFDQDEDRHQSEQQAAEQAIRDAEQALQEIALPDGGVDDHDLRMIHAEVRLLKEDEQAIQQAEREHAAAGRRLLEAHGRLIAAGYEEEELPEALRQLSIPEVTEYARRREQLSMKLRAAEYTRAWLTELVQPDDAVRALNLPPEVSSTEVLREGHDALARWLASPDPQALAQAMAASTGAARLDAAGAGTAPKRRWLLIAAALLIVVLAVVLVVVQSLFWLAAIVVAGVLIMFDVMWSRRSGPETGPGSVAARDDRATYRSKYEETSLPLPDQWDINSVSQRLMMLARIHAKQQLIEERERRLAELITNATALEREAAELDAERRKIESSLGIALRVDDVWLSTLAGTLAVWQKAHTERAGCAAALELDRSRHAQRHSALNARMQIRGYPELHSAAEADEVARDLQNRVNRHREMCRTRDDTRRRLETSIRPNLERTQHRRAAMFREIGLEEEARHELHDLVRRLDEWQVLGRQQEEAQAVRASLSRQLESRPDLLELSEQEVDVRLQMCREADDKRDQLTKEITRIEQEIASAKAGSSVTEAISRVDQARAELARERDEAANAVAGFALTNWVKRTAVDTSRPAVFKRANALLLRFTHGALALELTDQAQGGSPGPAFAARTDGDMLRPLDQLSVGERIQLLMAIRLAYIEQHEPIRLPLLLDEALGTSDDGRAGVIIDSVIEIARSGRQVFYFTAQHDEVGKWIARLRQVGMDHCVIDLSTTRHLSAARMHPLPITSIEEHRPLAPEPGQSYEAYGEALAVPGLNPHQNTADHVHLWHLFDDAEVLHQVLSLHIERWGQLKRYIDAGGIDSLIASINDEQRRNACRDGIRRASHLARAIEEAFRAWKVGRGSPVDREVLIASNVVSERFLDDIAELARQCGGDAGELLRQLDDNDIKGWGRGKTDKLREYLETEGYVVDTAPHAHDELTAAAMTAASDGLRDGLFDAPAISTLIRRLPGM